MNSPLALHVYINMYFFLLAFASLTLTSIGYVFVKKVDSDSPNSYNYDGYRVKTVIDQVMYSAI
jgi:hypothetical protein